MPAGPTVIWCPETGRWDKDRGPNDSSLGLEDERADLGPLDLKYTQKP
jgi:hypothetical protein